MKTVDQFNVNGKRALIRVDFNVPLNAQFQVTDDTRIRKAIPTIQSVLNRGGSVVLMSHLGRPKGEYEEKYSLKHIIPTLEQLLGQKVLFSSDCVGEEATVKAQGLNVGEVLLLENLRFHPEEKKGDALFAKQLSKLGDLYVNDAFGTAHRAHASTSIVADNFNEKMFGYIMKSELENLERVVSKPNHPFTAILGGAKVSGKIEVIEKMLDVADNIIIGGGMMFTFIKALGGSSVGTSLVEDDLLEVARETVRRAKEKGVQLLIAHDVVAADRFGNDALTQICSAHSIPDGWMGLDIGDESIEEFRKVILSSKTILWNGPMGVFEMPSFEKGTIAVAKALAEATEAGAFTLVGGGDSVAAINKCGLADQVSYVSTGGGAMLEYVEGKALPGVVAILE